MPYTTIPIGEEDREGDTTHAIGEEGGGDTTDAIGEEDGSGISSTTENPFGDF
jgi:hypothetical protein